MGESVIASLREANRMFPLLRRHSPQTACFPKSWLGPDGSFGYRLLPLYWSDPDCHPFLVRIDGKLAGFALVKKGSEVSRNGAVWDMAEFFVIRGHRRRGFGTQVAHELWRRFPGAVGGSLAQRFWAHAVFMFTGEAVHPVPFEKGGKHWKLFSFESKGVS
jgi:GNAT superfamily N-acetyltransferase